MEAAGILPGSEAARAERGRPRMDPPNVLWFFGTFAIGFGAIALVDKVPGSNRHVWELLVSLGLVAAFALSARLLLRRSSLVPGGLAATLAVSVVPAVGVGFMSLIGTFPKDVSFDPAQTFSWSVFVVGVATILAGVLAFAWTRFSFVLFTVTIATAITAQLFLPLVDRHPSADGHFITAIVSGAILVAVGLLLDATWRRREAFWFHVIGFLSIAVALAYYAVPLAGNASRGWVPMLLTGAVVLLLSAPLRRATWAVYGVLGFYAPIYHWLTNGVNAGSTGYALLLLAIGVSIFLLGTGLHRFGRDRSDRRTTAADTR